MIKTLQKQWSKVRKNEKGFTLMELVIVMAVLGILITTMVPSLMGYIDEAKRSSANANARTISTAATIILTKHSWNITTDEIVLAKDDTEGWTELKDVNNQNFGELLDNIIDVPSNTKITIDKSQGITKVEIIDKEGGGVIGLWEKNSSNLVNEDADQQPEQ